MVPHRATGSGRGGAPARRPGPRNVTRALALALALALRWS